MVAISRIDTAVDEVRCFRRTGLPKEDLMTDTLSFAEIDGQHVELLPARTVLSLFSTGGCGDGGGGHGGGGHDGGDGGGRGGNGGYGGDGGTGRGGLGVNLLNINLFGDQDNSAGNGFGGDGGNANGGNGGNVSH
jgi:hypothetical protein